MRMVRSDTAGGAPSLAARASHRTAPSRRAGRGLPASARGSDGSNRSPRWHAIAAVALLATALAACGRGEGGLSPDDPIFDGLPRAAVVEALSLPRLRMNLEGMSLEQQRSLAQAGVRTLISCREALRVYETWIRTGVRPEISPGPVPTHPLEPGNRAVEEDYARLEAALASGDPDRLRALLLAEGGCGPNWPAEPGGPPIAEVVQELHA